MTSNPMNRDQLVENMSKLRAMVKLGYQKSVREAGVKNLVWSCEECGSTCPPFALHEYFLFEPEAVMKTSSFSRNSPKLPKIEVKESPLHGVGVFAVDAIKKGSVITYYPAHLLLVDTVQGKTAVMDVTGEYGDINSEALHTMMDTYALKICCIKFAGDPKKGRGEGEFCGHLINDCVDVHQLVPHAIKAFKSKSKEDFKSFLEFGGSNFQANAAYVTCLVKLLAGVPIIAIKDIAAGEEVTISYGFMWWFLSILKTQFPSRSDALIFASKYHAMMAEIAKENPNDSKQQEES